jgi:hypothetical protein
MLKVGSWKERLVEVGVVRVDVEVPAVALPGPVPLFDADAGDRSPWILAPGLAATMAGWLADEELLIMTEPV